MRVLICTVDGGGNVPPTVAIARELIGRGHEVRVLAGPYFPTQPKSIAVETAFSDAGAEVIYPTQESWARDAGAFPDVSVIPDHLEMVRSMSLWMPVAVPWATETTQQIEAFQPTVVMVDFLTPGAGIAAKAAGVSGVILNTTVQCTASCLANPFRGVEGRHLRTMRQESRSSHACRVRYR